jgi:hypothetical protein
MNNRKEYKKLIDLVKTLDVDNIILAIELSKGLGLTYQIISDIQSIMNMKHLKNYMAFKYPGVIDHYEVEDEYADLTKRAVNIYHIILNLGYDVRVRYYEPLLLKK